MLISHVTVGMSDRAHSMAFYDAILGPVGLTRRPIRHPSLIGYARGGGEDLPYFVLAEPFDGNPPTRGNGFHVAFLAPSEQAVRDFHQAALASGGCDDGPPGRRPHYAADYYGAYVRDPDGVKLQATFYGKGRSAGPDGAVYSHVCLPVDDYAIGVDFHTPLFASLGIDRMPEEESLGEDMAFVRAGKILPTVFVQFPFDGQPAAPGNGQHLALWAETRAQVDTFYELALSLGGRSEGEPGERPDYTQPYYGAYVRDPAGTKLQAVCRL